MEQLFFELTQREYETISGGERIIHRDKAGDEERKVSWTNALSDNQNDFNLELT